MTTVPMSKIVLKNTTKISLNERFTAYRQQAQSQDVVNNVRQKMQIQRQATVENRRLAQQMANRPSVIAALRIKKRLQLRLGQKRNSLTPASKSNVKSRLSLNSRRNSPVQGRLGGRSTNQERNINNRARRGGRRKNRGSAGFGTSPMLRARLGAKNTTNFNYRTNYRPRGGSGKFRGRDGNSPRGRRQNPPGQFQINRTSSRGAGRGTRGWRVGMDRKIVPTRQELDNQLDEYMAETKSHLDAQMDQYMSQGV